MRFKDLRAYPPEAYAGLLVFRLRRLLPLLAQEPLEGHIWMVEEERLRIRAG